MLSKHLIAAVLLIIVIALGTGIYFITKEKPDAELLPTQLTVAASMSMENLAWFTLTATLASNGAPLEGKVIEWIENFPPDYLSRLNILGLGTDSSGQVSVTFPAFHQVHSHWPWLDNAFRITASFAGDNQYRGSSGSVPIY
ncbi:MAG: hypothetical protein KAV43_00840 [Hadesarchaea archaeon]|nr:hypothetical protein [Hadesarchaea archaeon]